MNQELYQFYLDKLISEDLYVDEYGFLKASLRWYNKQMYDDLMDLSGSMPDEQRVKSPEFQKAFETYRKIPLIAALE